MVDRVYPASKPNPHPPSAAAAADGAAPSFPATKAQNYGRPMYRPQPPPKRRRSRRSCWCSCCLWLTLIILALAFIAAIAGGFFYLWYRPQRPSFKVTSLRIAQLNVSSSSNSLASRLDLTVLARNPNSKIDFVYGPISIAVASNGVSIGDGSFPAFVSAAKNSTVMKTTVSSSDQSIDTSTASDLKRKSKLPMEIELETKAGVKIGGMKSKKIGIKVSCNGVNVANPKKKAGSAPTSADFYCKVKLRIKIWLWTIV